MASPPSPASSPGNVSISDRQPSLEQLVRHFVAAKRSLSSVSDVWRANELVNSARILLEENAKTSAGITFLRCNIGDQLDSLDAILKGLEVVGAEGKAEFMALLQICDTSSSRLQATLEILRKTPIEPSLQPAPTPKKYLYDFIETKSLSDLNAALRACIDRVNDASRNLNQTIHGFDAALDDIHNALVPRSYPQQDASGSPLPRLFRELETHATETATCLQSLVRHYDRCVTALKHTEGGGEAASRAAGDTGVAGVEVESLHQDSSTPPQPLTSSERLDMLSVLDKDAEEVDDVITEIRERVTEMEALHDTMLAYLTQLRAEHSGLLIILQDLGGIRMEIPIYLTAAQEYLARWAEEKLKIEDGIDQLEDLKEFYQGFSLAYDGLLIEVARRRADEERKKAIALEAMDKIMQIHNDDIINREAFSESQGAFLPIDIWPGLQNPPLRFEIVTTEKDQYGSTPNISSSVVDHAVQRIQVRKSQQESQQDRQ